MYSCNIQEQKKKIVVNLRFLEDIDNQLDYGKLLIEMLIEHGLC